MSRHIALLRAVNVSGKNKLPMAELRALCAELGAKEVETYIQSGNVALRPARPAGFAEELSAAIRARFDFEVPVALFSARELATVVESNPFAAELLDDPKSVHVMFLSAKPAAAKVKQLDPERSPGDRFIVVGRAIYLHLTKGVGRSKLTVAWFERELGVVPTGRNWKTTLKLLEMASS